MVVKDILAWLLFKAFAPWLVSFLKIIAHAQETREGGGVKFLSAFDGIGSEYDKLALVL